MVATVDLVVGCRLRTGNERAMVRTGVAGHMGSARSPALVCSSARRKAFAVMVCCRVMSGAERGRVGPERTGVRACADLSLEKQARRRMDVAQVGQRTPSRARHDQVVAIIERPVIEGYCVG